MHLPIIAPPFYVNLLITVTFKIKTEMFRELTFGSEFDEGDAVFSYRLF